jgi:anti-sigma-K factor RskA
MSNPDRSGDDRLLAMLYAAGELDDTAAAAFECRLADDQSVREALCAAVRLQRMSAGNPDLSPDPRYRERVRQRLRTPTWRRIAGRVGARGSPGAWALAGAAVAAVMLLTLRHGFAPADVARTPAPSSVEEVAKQLPTLPAEFDVAGGCLDEWPDLSGGQHLAQAVDEEIRRKVRAEDRRMVRMEDGATRLRATQDYRQ